MKVKLVVESKNLCAINRLVNQTLIEPDMELLEVYLVTKDYR